MKVKNLDANLCTHVELIGFLSVDEDFKAKLNTIYLEGKLLSFLHHCIVSSKMFFKDFEYLVAYLKKVQVPVILGFGKDDGITTKWYSFMAANDDKRSNFVQSVLSVIDQYDLNGFFVLWEYPTYWDVSIKLILN
jgi:GH18 family chitinase